MQYGNYFEKKYQRKIKNMKLKSLFTIALSLLFYTFLNAQSLGGHPSDVKWQQIDTKNVRVIFPKGLEKKAFRIADIINYVNKNNTYSVGEKSKKLELVLQTNQVISNGFVALAPYRSEFFGTGLQDNSLLGSLDWLDVLSLHEYRHALQYVNGDRGFTKFLHILQGQAGWALGINLAVPSWYFEGDAVVAETVLSKSGRGRTPSFFKSLRANLLNNKDYSYMTSRNGSLKHMLPDHYKMGYTINNYMRNTYGMSVCKDILADAGRFRSVFYPFSGAMKRHTGKRVGKMYKSAYAQLKKQWEDELKNIQLIPTKNITKKPKNTVTNYAFPQILNDGSIVAIKDSYKEIKHLVHIKNGEETQLCTYGMSPIPFLSAQNGKLAWVELQKDPRRANRNYTRVVSFDMNSLEKKYITSKSKYFSPEFSSKGDKIIVVKADENIQNSLVIINANNGEVISELPNPKNDFLSFPKWANNDKDIVFLAKRNSQLALMKYDLDTKTTQQLTDWTAHTIGSFDVVGNTVYFASSYSGIDNIYSVNTNGDKKITKISSVRIGAYEPVVSKNQKELVMVEFSDMGSLLTKMDLASTQTEKGFTYVEPIKMGRYNIKTNEHEQNIFNKIENKTYKVKPYKGFFKGIKLHSWTLGATENNPSLSLSFDNILTDFKANIGAVYNKNEKKVNYFGDIIYSKYFVEMGLHAQINNRSVNYFNVSDLLGATTFSEKNYGASASVPLNWNKGSFLFGFKPKVAYTFYKTDTDNTLLNLPMTKKSLSFGSISSEVSFSAQQMKAVQNIQPRWGVVLNAQHQKSLKESVTAERINTAGTVFLPALMKNHGIKIDANWQKELTTNNFKFVDDFNYARGYDQMPSDEVFKLGLNYALPLFYPDWGFAGITYFKRVRTNLFYDMSKIKYNNITTDQNSYGVELFFDNTLLNMIPFTFGVRQSFLMNKDIINPDRKNKFELVFKIGF